MTTEDVVARLRRRDRDYPDENVAGNRIPLIADAANEIEGLRKVLSDIRSIARRDDLVASWALEHIADLCDQEL